MQNPDHVAAVDAAIASRHSMRAFLPTPVPRATIDHILEVAARAPSGTNTQPWQVHVLTGAKLKDFTAKLHAAYLDPAQRAAERPEYAYYPTEWRSPYIDRRRKVGWDLYGLLDIGKADRVMEQGSWLDYGMFLQNIMVAARGRGLHTCPQAAFIEMPGLIARELNLPPEHMVVCGMALGHADPLARENTLITERDPVAGFTTYWD